MASPNFIAYDRSLRRIYMLNLIEALTPPREFRASLVVNPHTGLPLPIQRKRFNDEAAAEEFNGTRLAADGPVNFPRA